MIRNVHVRTVADPALAGVLIDSLASPDDRLWPAPRWPALELEAGLQPGSRGGHGPIRYAVESVEPGREVVFRFDPAIGLEGTHRFTVGPGAATGAVLSHVLEARAAGRWRLLWALGLRWMHDALIEDAFDRAEADMAGRPWQPRRLGAWVRICWAAARHAAPEPDRQLVHH